MYVCLCECSTTHLNQLVFFNKISSDVMETWWKERVINTSIDQNNEWLTGWFLMDHVKPIYTTVSNLFSVKWFWITLLFCYIVNWMNFKLKIHSVMKKSWEIQNSNWTAIWQMDMPNNWVSPFPSRNMRSWPVWVQGPNTCPGKTKQCETTTQVLPNYSFE